VIRFKCPHCGRQYELPAVLARMPLLCKGCGQSISAPPDAVDEPEPQPELKLPPPPPKPVAPPSPPKKPEPPPPPPEEESERPVLIEEPDRAPVPIPVAKHEAALAPAAAEKREPPLPPAVTPARGNVLPMVVDVAVGLTLLMVSVLLGEILCGKPTGRAWHDAAGAVEFPPTELLMWAAPPLTAMLGYALLVSRGITVGLWLKRRAG
jgi:hypothetical protein